MGTPAMTGTVNFFDNSTNTALGTQAVTPTGTGGTAMLAVSNLAAETHVVNARYSGDSNYQASTAANQTVVVTATPQTITFPPIPNHTAGDMPFAINATASSGLVVSYAVTAGPATIAGNVVTLTGAGTVQIQATQAGTTTYAAATPVTQTFTVSLPAPTLVSIAPAVGVIGSGATTITLTGTSFASTDTVQLTGAAIPTTFVSSTTLTAIVPASFLNATGTGQITVFDSVTKSTTAAQSFSVLAAPDINFSGPSTAASASQPSLTFQLIDPYPFPIAGSLSLAFNLRQPTEWTIPQSSFRVGAGLCSTPFQLYRRSRRRCRFRAALWLELQR